jgi:hypothetical protein
MTDQLSAGQVITHTGNIYDTLRGQNGVKVKVTVPAVVSDRDRGIFEVGCQSFNANEVLRAHGTIGEETAPGRVPVTFRGEVYGDRTFRVPNVRDVSLNEIAGHALQVEVIEVPEVTAEEFVDLFPGMFTCHAHPGQHVFVAQAPTAAATRLSVVRLRQASMLRLGEEGKSFEDGFAHWPDCRPEPGSSFRQMFGVGQRRGRMPTRCTPSQFTLRERVPAPS